MYELEKKKGSYLRVNLLGPGPRLMKKEFTGPRSHTGWETGSGICELNWSTPPAEWTERGFCGNMVKFWDSVPMTMIFQTREAPLDIQQSFYIYRSQCRYYSKVNYWPKNPSYECTKHYWDSGNLCLWNVGAKRKHKIKTKGIRKEGRY